MCGYFLRMRGRVVILVVNPLIQGKWLQEQNKVLRRGLTGFMFFIKRAYSSFKVFMCLKKKKNAFQCFILNATAEPNQLLDQRYPYTALAAFYECFLEINAGLCVLLQTVKYQQDETTFNLTQLVFTKSSFLFLFYCSQIQISIILAKEMTSCSSPLACCHSNSSCLSVLTWFLPLDVKAQDICLSSFWTADFCLGFSPSFAWMSLP